MTLKLIRTEAAGGTCGICGSIVELLMDREPWQVSCDCHIIDIPVWCIKDAYSRLQFRKKFEWREC